MPSKQELTNIVEKVKKEANHTYVTIDKIIESFERRGFGILLIIPSILLLIPPFAAIPGVPFLLGLLIAILSIQIILRVKRPWVPKKLLNIKIKSKILKKGINKLLPLIKKIDSYTYRRMDLFMSPPMIMLLALLCLVLSLLIMFIGFIPFLPFALGILVLFFGLGLSTCDGLVICIGLILTVLSSVLIILIIY